MRRRRNALGKQPEYGRRGQRGGDERLSSIDHKRQARFAFLDDERGASGVEYGLLVALIAVVIISTVATLGQSLIDGFQTVIDKL